jgi:hypothetical protein
MVRYTTFAPYSFWVKGTLPLASFEESKCRWLKVLRSWLATLGLCFAVCVFSPFLTALNNIQLLLPRPARNEVESIGLALITYAFIIVFTIAFLNICLLDPVAGLFQWSSEKGKALWLAKILRPAVRRFSAILIRQHIYAQLQTIVRLYRARIAARTAHSEEELMTLADMAEQASKLRDSYAPQSQFAEILRFPSIIVGSLFLLGFIHTQQLSPWLSILIGCVLLTPYVLACKVEHVAREWEIPLDARCSHETESASASLYTLESRLYNSLECLGTPHPVRTDLVLQIFAGVLISVGGIIFSVQISPRTAPALVFWLCLDLLLVFFLVFKPWQELKQREVRYGKRFPEVPSSQGRREKNGLRVGTRLRWAPSVMMFWGPVVVVFLYTSLPFSQWMYAQTAGLLDFCRSSVRFADQHVGKPMQFVATKGDEKDELSIRPQGSDRNCSMATGDKVTILNDETTVEIVSSAEATCPARYRAALTSNVLAGIGGPHLSLLSPLSTRAASPGHLSFLPLKTR